MQSFRDTVPINCMSKPESVTSPAADHLSCPGKTFRVIGLWEPPDSEGVLACRTVHRFFPVQEVYTQTNDLQPQGSIIPWRLCVELILQ